MYVKQITMKTLSILLAKNELGRQVVALLNLKPNKETKKLPEDEHRFETSWGTKSLVGLAECIDRLVEENKKLK
jgi:hypothetical protein